MNELNTNTSQNSLICKKIIIHFDFHFPFKLGQSVSSIPEVGNLPGGLTCISTFVLFLTRAYLKCFYYTVLDTGGGKVQWAYLH